jgi:hypothetical protein
VPEAQIAEAQIAMATPERAITSCPGESMFERVWPAVDEIVEQFEKACVLLADFVALHDEVVANADRRSLRSVDGSTLTIAQCRQWVADRRELVEAIAIRFEALNIITSGTTAAQAVYLRDLLNG